ncbi:MAG: CRISPR-associated endonuclease Cas2 [Synergistaceae bacterium]|jgi:CRISPR-associated protein Cas2|nr:CRISPR-associated endonuclease Cas2 [Synergistaceae bacterium]
MFVLMFYDVGEKRVAKVLKTARRYLTWIQNSVLEGDLTPAQLEALKIDVKKVIDEKYDSVLLYVWRVERYMQRDSLGVERGTTDYMV